MLPASWKSLGFTSGRRTYLGNKKVGGVANSDHLTGSAADFTAPLPVVRAQFPNARILDEGDHRHVSGLSDVPYHGQRGTMGLVNGVDTTAPKGQPMIRPRKAQPKAAAPVLAPPPAAMPEPFQMNAQLDPATMAPDMPLAEAQPQLKKGGIFGSGLNGWDMLGIVSDGYLQANGQQGAYMTGKKQEREMQFDRDKFNQELEARREMAMTKAAMPKAPTQTDRYLAEILDPNTDPKRKAMLRQIIARPIGVPVYGADGQVKTDFYYPDQMPGMNGASDDEWEDVN